jgi:RimJ/RimL family protein N-acetyltransferase
MSRAIAFIDHENHRMRALALAAGFRVVAQDEFCGKMIASIFSGEHSEALLPWNTRFATSADK